MSTYSEDHGWQHFVHHIKENWAESVIFSIFLAAVLFLVLTSTVSG